MFGKHDVKLHVGNEQINMVKDIKEETTSTGISSSREESHGKNTEGNGRPEGYPLYRTTDTEKLSTDKKRDANPNPETLDRSSKKKNVKIPSDKKSAWSLIPPVEERKLKTLERSGKKSAESLIPPVEERKSQGRDEVVRSKVMNLDCTVNGVAERSRGRDREPRTGRREISSGRFKPVYAASNVLVKKDTLTMVPVETSRRYRGDALFEARTDTQSVGVDAVYNWKERGNRIAVINPQLVDVFIKKGSNLGFLTTLKERTKQESNHDDDEAVKRTMMTISTGYVQHWK